MAGYNYTKRSVHSWHTGYITLKEVLQLLLFTLTLKEVFTLFMAGYNYTKRSVHSLHGWLQLH